MNYHYALHNFAEERSSHPLRDGSLKSREDLAGLSQTLLPVYEMTRSHVTEDHNLHNLRR